MSDIRTYLRLGRVLQAYSDEEGTGGEGSRFDREGVHRYYVNSTYLTLN